MLTTTYEAKGIHPIGPPGFRFLTRMNAEPMLRRSKAAREWAYRRIRASGYVVVTADEFGALKLWFTDERQIALRRTHATMIDSRTLQYTEVDHGWWAQGIVDRVRALVDLVELLRG